MTTTITRTVNLPDPVRISRFRKAPELGPKILFFSGGTALKKLSQTIIHYTHNSIHIITPFDSGGSSAEIRKAYQMLAVGDIRNRIMALADQSVQGNPDIYELFSYRLPKDAENKELLYILNNMILNKSPMINKIHNPMRKIIRNHLSYFLANMPNDFNLKGANIGNLILTGGFLNNHRHIDPVIYIFSKLVEAKGVVRPIISNYLHLVAELENGETIVGQHNFTGKETNPINSPIKSLYLTKNTGTQERIEVEIRDKTINLIHDAELIVYPMGSFYSSIIANLLPKGVGQAISKNNSPKIYIPNIGNDPEQFGQSLSASVQTLLHYLQKSCYQQVPNNHLLNYILIDNSILKQVQYEEIDKINQWGIKILSPDLIDNQRRDYLDETRIIDILLSLI